MADSSISIDGKASGGNARRWALALLIVAIGVVSTVVVTVGADRGSARAATPAAGDGDIDSPANAALLHTAEEELIRRCMAGKGFTYEASPAPQQTTAHQFPYVLDDVAWARAHAFYAGELAADRPARSAYLAAMSPSRLAAYAQALDGGGSGADDVQVTLPGGSVLGHSTAGCQAAAEGRLYGNFPTWFTDRAAATYFISKRQGDVIGDPAYVAGVHTWVACMAKAGFAVITPQATANTYASDSHPTSTQTEAAVQEALCAGQTGLGALARRLDADYRSLMSAPDLQMLDQFRRLGRDAIPRAHAVLADGAQR